MGRETRFTSGFSYNDDGSMCFLVNTKYYYLEDDKTCFEFSSIFHRFKDIEISDSYKIMRADIEYTNDNSWDVNIDWNENGKNELRVYKVINN